MTAPATAAGRWTSLWGLALVPLLLLGAVLAYLVATGGGLKTLQGPPVEQLKVSRVTLPERGVIQVHLVNDGPQTVTVPQVMVDDAFWSFTAQPAGPIPRLGRATLTIPYPWVDGEAHKVALLTSLGTVFEAEIPVATLTPQPGRDLLVRFGLVGLYVGVVPVVLGMLWFPWMRRLLITVQLCIVAVRRADAHVPVHRSPTRQQPFRPTPVSIMVVR